MLEENRQTGGKRMGDAEPQPPKLLEQLRESVRVRHYSLRTEDAYSDWARRFILFHGKRHPKDMGAPEVQAFLTHLAVERHVAPSTRLSMRDGGVGGAASGENWAVLAKTLSDCRVGATFSSKDFGTGRS